jgi:hypothetical protein
LNSIGIKGKTNNNSSAFTQCSPETVAQSSKILEEAKAIQMSDDLNRHESHESHENQEIKKEIKAPTESIPMNIPKLPESMMSMQEDKKISVEPTEPRNNIIPQNMQEQPRPLQIPLPNPPQSFMMHPQQMYYQNPRVYKPPAAIPQENYAQPMPQFQGNPNVPIGILNQLAQLQHQQAVMQNILNSYGIFQQNSQYMPLINPQVSNPRFNFDPQFAPNYRPAIPVEEISQHTHNRMQQYGVPNNNTQISPHPIRPIPQHNQKPPIKNSPTSKKLRGLENLIKVALEKPTMVSIPISQCDSTVVKLQMNPTREQASQLVAEMEQERNKRKRTCKPEFKMNDDQK